MGMFTENGYQKENLEEWLTKIEQYEQDLVDESIDLDSATPVGNIVNLLAQLASDFDNVVEASYWTRDIDNTTGLFLTKLCTETGTYRKDATPTIVSDVMFYGDEGTILPSGTTIKQPKKYLPLATLVYTLVDDTVITKTSARTVIFSVDEITSGMIYTITIDGNDYAHTSHDGTTILGLYQGLYNLLHELYTVTYNEEGISITSTEDVSFTATNMNIDSIGVVGDVKASINGSIVCAPNTLTEIVTSGITGWYSVNNPNDGTLGSNIEKDEVLRLRQQTELNSVSGTDEAIQKSITKNVEDVSLALVQSNRLEVYDGERPPHSVECVVSGGAVNDIAQAIYDVAPTGIQIFGRNEEGTAVNDEGVSITIAFTRPVSTYISVRYTRHDNDEQSLPDNYISLIQSAVMTYANSNFGIGDDVVTTRLIVPFYSVDGSIIDSVEVAQKDTAEAIVAEEDWQDISKIVIDPFEEAVFDTSRILVEDA